MVLRKLARRFIRPPWTRWILAAGALALYAYIWDYNMTSFRYRATPVRLTWSEALFAAPFAWWIAASLAGFLLVAVFTIFKWIVLGAVWIARKTARRSAPPLPSPERRGFLERTAVAIGAAPFAIRHFASIALAIICVGSLLVSLVGCGSHSSDSTGTPALKEPTTTYSAGGANDSPTIAALQRALSDGIPGAERDFWHLIGERGAPLIEPAASAPDFSYVTFVWHGDNRTRNVVIFDGVAAFDAKDRMVRVDSTDIWYKTYRVRNDARFAYNLSPNDSLQPFDQVKGDEAMHARLAVFRADPLNPHHCPTTFGPYGTESSYVELPAAPPLVWSESLDGIRRGSVETRSVSSKRLGGEKKVWVYTPPGFTRSSRKYPLLLLFDGDRNIYWIPKLLDLLIARGRIPPMIAVMTDESTPRIRNTELACNPTFTAFLTTELIPWARQNYGATTSPSETIVAGSSYGGLAAVYAGMQSPETFGNVIALSGSFWWKPAGTQVEEWLVKQVKAASKLPVRFYLEVGEMESYPMQIRPNRDMREALRDKGYAMGYLEFDGGHSYLTWSNGMVRGLEFVTPRKQGGLPGATVFSWISTGMQHQFSAATVQ